MKTSQIIKNSSGMKMSRVKNKQPGGKEESDDDNNNTFRDFPKHN